MIGFKHEFEDFVVPVDSCRHLSHTLFRLPSFFPSFLVLLELGLFPKSTADMNRTRGSLQAARSSLGSCVCWKLRVCRALTHSFHSEKSGIHTHAHTAWCRNHTRGGFPCFSGVSCLQWKRPPLIKCTWRLFTFP